MPKYLLPPYTKIHIIVFGTLALIVSVIYFLFFLPNPKKDLSKAQVTPITPVELKQDFEQPLQKAQSGRYDLAWAENGFLMYDIRSYEAFKEKHIVGAKNIPVENLSLSALPAGVTSIIYSTSQEDLDAAVGIFEKQGITTIYTLSEPLDVLEQEGYKLAEGEMQRL